MFLEEAVEEAEEQEADEVVVVVVVIVDRVIAPVVPFGPSKNADVPPTGEEVEDAGRKAEELELIGLVLCCCCCTGLLRTILSVEIELLPKAAMKWRFACGSNGRVASGLSTQVPPTFISWRCCC